MAAPLVALAGKFALRAAVQMGLTSPGARKVAAGVAVTALIAPAGLVLGGLVVVTSSTGNIGGANEAAVLARCVGSPVSDVPDAGSDLATLTPAQRESAATIIGVTRSAILLPGGVEIAEETQKRAAIIALATAMQESRLTNLSGGDRDSVGLFQQRPSMDWGTVAQITNPEYAATAFLYGAGSNRGLVDIAGWQDMDLTVAAQAVQRSGFPLAYAQWETLATALVEQMWPTTAALPIHPDLDRPELGDPDAVLTPVNVIPAGDTTCAAPTGDYTTWDGVYRTPQPWGGYTNGRIPLGAMCVISFAPSHVARCDAAEALVQLNEVYKADHGGQNLIIVSSYRTYERQVQIKQDYIRQGKGHLAATPGKSNHGLGMAVDLGNFGGVGDYTKPNYAWMMANGPKFGWVNPPFMQEGGSGPLEPWHWEFMGEPEYVADENPEPPVVAVTIQEAVPPVQLDRAVPGMTLGDHAADHDHGAVVNAP